MSGEKLLGPLREMIKFVKN